MRIAVLLAATLTTAMTAGLFYAYSISVMPALARTGDAVFVEVMQRINTAIMNGWFALCFGGAPVLTAVAAVLYARSGPASVAVPVLVALVLYVGQLALTFGLHVPLNNGLGTARATADPGAARAVFEARWVRWNHARTWLCTGSAAALCWSLAAA